MADVGLSVARAQAIALPSRSGMTLLWRVGGGASDPLGVTGSHLLAAFILAD